MIEHFKKIEFLYGSNCSIYIPNEVFKDLTTVLKSIKGGNIKELSFSYAYLVTVGFLYRYANYVDVDEGTYIQNRNIKELLGYSHTTKTVDKIIKKNGILDMMGLTDTIKNYPVFFNLEEGEINKCNIVEFTTIDELDDKDKYKSIVKNRNFEVKDPTYITSGYKDREYGTLYDTQNTHRVTIGEFIKFIEDEKLNNTDFLLYCYFKSKCKGFKKNKRELSLSIILSDIDISQESFYRYLKNLKDMKFIKVKHRGGWVVLENNDESVKCRANEYTFLGI